MKTWHAALLLSLLIAAVIVGQTEVRLATVEGTVKNVKTGEPIPDVRVTVTSDPLVAAATKSATTDADGKFTIPGVPPGRYLVSAVRTLFFRPRRDAGVVALTVAEGQRMNGVQILLSPTGVIAGRVIDERREPLRSVRVEALRREYRDGARTWVQAAMSTTDDRGDYRLFNLSPGSYYVRATQNNTITLYYPGLADSQSAVPVSIEAGSEAGAIDIEMRRSPEYSVLFKLAAVPPGSMTNITLRRRNGLANEPLLPRPENLPDNTYKLSQLTAGAYDILVQVYSAVTTARTLTHSLIIPVNVGNSNVDLGTLALRQTTAVAGRILVPDPLPSPIVPDRLSLTLRALDLPIAMAFGARGNTTPPGFNPDGTFTVPNVAAGRYQIVLTGLPADAYLTAAREGTREVLDTGFTVNGNQNPLELTVGGSGSVGHVNGTVINALGQPVPSSTVVLVPAPDRRSNPAAYRSVIADQLGNFSIRSVLAGDYKVIAWEDIEPGIYMDPEFFKNYETRGESVRLQKGSQSAVTVRVVPAQ